MVDAAERGRQHAVAPHRVDHAHGRVLNGQHAREQAEDRRYLDDLRHPRRVPVRQRRERRRVAQERRQLRRVVEVVARRQRVHHEDVEDADDRHRTEHGAGDDLARVARFLAQHGGRLEADEGEDAEHRAEGDARDPVGRGGGREVVQRVAVTGLGDGDHAEDDEDQHLEAEQHQVHPHRRLDRADRQPEHEAHEQDAQDPPRDVEAPLAVEVVVQEGAVRGEQADGEHDEGREVQPAREEAGAASEAVAAERVERAARRQPAGELDHRVGYERGRDERAEERQRQRRPCVRRRGRRVQDHGDHRGHRGRRQRDAVGQR